MTSPTPTLPLSSEDLSRLGRRTRLAGAMRRFYRQLDAGITAFAPTCRNRGLCCRFGRAGHRLFVTSLELIYFAARVTDGSGELPWADAAADRCPYQISGECAARDARPLGCRVYFCQASAAWWQPRVSERWLARLKRMHRELGVPYAYVEWLTALRAMRGRLAGGQNASMAPETDQ